MRWWLPRGGLRAALLVVLPLSCAPHPGVDPTPGTEASTEIGAAPFRLLTMQGREIVRLELGGKLVTAKGEVLARVAGHTVTVPDGTRLAWVGDDNTVGLAGVQPGSHFDPRGSLELPDRSLFISASTVSLPDGEMGHLASVVLEDGTKVTPSVVFAGVTRTNTQTATLVLAMILLRVVRVPGLEIRTPEATAR